MYVVSGQPLRIKAKGSLAPKQLENGYMMLVNSIASPRHQINSEEAVRDTRENILAVAAAAMRYKVLFWKWQRLMAVMSCVHF